MGLTYEEAERAGIAHLHPDGSGGADAASASTPGPGPWTVLLPGWHPPTVNALMRGHWAKRAGIKKAAVARVAAAVRAAGVPLASGKRRVTVTVAVTNRSHAPDPDNVLKSIMDGLKRAGAIVDDRSELCEWPMPVVEKGPEKLTRVVIEDVAEGV